MGAQGLPIELGKHAVEDRLFSLLQKIGYTHCCGRRVILVAAELQKTSTIAPDVLIQLQERVVCVKKKSELTKHLES